jgi:hypothetical protein
LLPKGEVLKVLLESERRRQPSRADAEGAQTSGDHSEERAARVRLEVIDSADVQSLGEVHGQTLMTVSTKSSSSLGNSTLNLWAIIPKMLPNVRVHSVSTRGGASCVTASLNEAPPKGFGELN